MDVISEEESINEEACGQVAVQNGHTIEEAELCDTGSLNCPNCPFRPYSVSEYIKNKKSSVGQG